MSDKYKQMLIDHIAKGGLIVPLSQCGLAKQFTYLTLKGWVAAGVFPHIKVGNRTYTNDEIIAAWISDGQMDKTVFSQKHSGRKPGDGFPKRKVPVVEEKPPEQFPPPEVVEFDEFFDANAGDDNG